LTVHVFITVFLSRIVVA